MSVQTLSVVCNVLGHTLGTFVVSDNEQGYGLALG